MGNNLKCRARMKRILRVYFKYLIFFVVGCFLGCIFETTMAYLKKGYLVSRQGLIYGPFSPVYGVGIALAVLLLERFRKKNQKLPIFILGGLSCGIAEYICSFVQEYVFHTYSWNYSRYPLDIQGRTSVIHMAIWGLLIFLFMQYVYPYIIKFIEKIDYNFKAWLSALLTLFFAFNIAVSSFACQRQYERFKKIPADSGSDVFFDKHYPDDYLEKIYPNKRYIKNKKNK